MLLDPLEEQLDLPALLVQCRDFLSAAFEIIGDQYQIGLIAVAADPKEGLNNSPKSAIIRPSQNL